MPSPVLGTEDKACNIHELCPQDANSPRREIRHGQKFETQMADSEKPQKDVQVSHFPGRLLGGGEEEEKALELNQQGWAAVKT